MYCKCEITIYSVVIVKTEGLFYIFWKPQQHVFTALHIDYSLMVIPLTYGLQRRTSC